MRSRGPGKRTGGYLTPKLGLSFLCDTSYPWGPHIGPPVFNPGAGGDTIPPSQCLTRYGRVTSKGYPTLSTCPTLQYHFYNATCPHRCIHGSLLVLYQLGNYYGRYTACIRRDSISFYAMSFYSAACYVFAYGWGRGQPVVLSDLPIGSKCSRTLSLTHTQCGACYPIGLP